MARTSISLTEAELIIIDSLLNLGDTPSTEAVKKSGGVFVNDPVVGSLIYKGVWDANANTPTVTSGVGTLGEYWFVGTAGSTSIDGISSWAVGDMLLFNGTSWQKIDNQGGGGGGVSTWNGLTGVVVAGQDDLNDTTITGVGTGDFLRHNGTIWVNTTIQASDIPSGIDAANISSGVVSNTEFDYLNGVTSGIQGQIDGKQDDLNGLAIPTATVATGDKILLQDINDSDNLKTVTAQSIADLADPGVSSWNGQTGVVTAGQDDLNDTTITAAGTGDYLRNNAGTWVNDTIQAGDLPSGIDATNIADGSVNNTEFQYINSLTSNAQTQINGKQEDLDGAVIPTATVATDDKVLIQDTNDSDNLKTITAQSIADLASGGVAEMLPGDASFSTMPYYYDELDGNLFVADGGNIQGYRGHLSGAAQKYSSGSAYQIATTTINASLAAAAEGIAVVGGYVYVMCYNSTSPFLRRLFRCDITNDITSGGNWSEITLSGANMTGGSSGFYLSGYGDGAFWFVNGADSLIVKATLSGTTITQQSTITVTGMTYNGSTVVNGEGVFAYFNSNPRMRFASYVGTLDGRQWEGRSNNVPMGVGDTAYIKSAVNDFVRLQ